MSYKPDPAIDPDAYAGDGAGVVIGDGRDEIGRMGRPVMRVFRALQLALVVGWAGLAFKWWWLAGLMTPAVVSLGAWLWVKAEHDVKGGS